MAGGGVGFLGEYLDLARRVGPNLRTETVGSGQQAENEWFFGGTRNVPHKNEGDGDTKEGKEAQYSGCPFRSQDLVHFAGKKLPKPEVSERCA